MWNSRNSGGGEIRFCVEPLNGFIGDRFVKLGEFGEFGDFGDFKIVAYNEPSNGPWVCDEPERQNNK